MGPILRLQNELELASELGQTLSHDRVLQFTESALRLMGNSYQVSIRERRKAILKQSRYH